MTIAEIVQDVLYSYPGLWDRHDYEKAWLVKQLARVKPLRSLQISPSDYAELERKVREWEGK